MPRNLNNQKRALADVISIDAWHDAFNLARQKVALHADVIFGTALVGGESDCPVRFRLSVKQAEVVVIIPNLEPVSVDKKSVARDAPKVRGHRTETSEKKSRIRANVKASASASTTRLTGSASAYASAEADQLRNERLSVSADFQQMNVIQSQTNEGNYRWLLTPGNGPKLEGRPWDAVKRPRLKLIDNRPDSSKGVPPIVRVEVQCLREDLVIEGLELKDEALFEKVKNRLGFNNRMAAAVSYIRDRLRAENLEVENIDEAFARLTLGSMAAQSIS